MSRVIHGRRCPRRGFAMIVAVALVALVAVALGAVMSLFRLDLDRTANALEQAQLRQMLLAGERAARGQLETVTANPQGAQGPAPVVVALPAALVADGGALSVSVTTSGAEADESHSGLH